MRTLLLVLWLCLLVGSAYGQAPLTAVAHDSTLTGDGKTSSPLGVVNGGITTSKLADGSVTASKIAAGVIPAGTLRAVDNADVELGVYEFFPATGGEAAIQFFPAINMWLRLPISPLGFETRPLSLFYESTDCSGTPYSNVGNGIDPLVIETYPSNSTAYFYSGPQTVRIIRSRNTNATLQNCEPFNATIGGVQVSAISLSGFTTPFKVVR